MPVSLLLVADDPLVRRWLGTRLAAVGHRVTEAPGVAAAVEILAASTFDAVLMDFWLSDGSGFDLLPQLEAKLPGVPILMLTAHRTVENAVEAVRRGTRDDAPRERVANGTETASPARERRRPARRVDPASTADAFLGTSRAAAALREQVRRVARSPARAVLLESESGTGKGLVARAIHEESTRASKPFVSITCSAIPEALLESELFGHESGAFTDARHRKIGLIEAASGGTLFLDEIGDMSSPLQAKLLGILEERRFRRVGGVEEIEADVRVVSATNRDLLTLVREGRFREDLLYRLRVVPIRIPPLREHPEDVPLLLAHFVRQIAEECGRPALRVSPVVIGALAARPWPGNVRELRNAAERAVILAEGDELVAKDFREEAPSTGPLGAPKPWASLPPEGVNIEELTDAFVRQALVRTAGNQSAAARLVGMSRDQIRYRMQRLGLWKDADAAKRASPAA